ncbi:hypothetical protein BT69DRAFT_726114 [Atractiella rhizophila]|nr:hypothetical protein BT69DRAFT_726114 [Atractiella rhizophila]
MSLLPNLRPTVRPTLSLVRRASTAAPSPSPVPPSPRPQPVRDVPRAPGLRMLLPEARDTLTWKERLLIRVLGENLVYAYAANGLTRHWYQECRKEGGFEGKNAVFWYETCELPRTFFTVRTITHLHLYLVNSRLRALPRSYGRQMMQKFANHAFIDVEQELAEDGKKWGLNYNTDRTIKKHTTDFYQQYLGMCLALDEGVLPPISPPPVTFSTTVFGNREPTNPDVILASALWRNIWASGWGAVEGVDTWHKNEKTRRKLEQAEMEKEAKDVEEGLKRYTILEPEEGKGFKDPTLFPKNLERIVLWFRKELVRMANIPDEEIINGKAVFEFTEFGRI